MNDSILDTIKKLLGVDDEYFDVDIITHINTVFDELNQLGVGPEEGFSITDNSTTWGEYLQSNKLLNCVKTFIYARVKMVFDPPINSIAANALTELIKEQQFRINVTVDKWEGDKHE